MALISWPLGAFKTYVGSFTWAPFVGWSRSTVLRLLQRIENGQLVVTDCDGSVTICGNAGQTRDEPRTQLTVLKEAFWVRLLLFADMVRCACLY